jgi:hypothetical protein
MYNGIAAVACSVTLMTSPYGYTVSSVMVEPWGSTAEPGANTPTATPLSGVV